MSDKFYVTTPIYYVNDIPHIGHAYTTIAADIISRYNRLLGKDVYFLTGTDEHGMKIAEAAEKQGKDPKSFTDSIVVRFKDVWEKLYISNNDFIRTTDERHKKAVQTLFKTLHEKGDIYKGEYEGWYCTPCETYWTDFQIQEHQATLKDEEKSDEVTCPDCSRPVTRLKENSFFFKMSNYQDRLLKYYEDNPDFIQPQTRKNEVLSFVKSGLKDISITRTTFSWGVPVPEDIDKDAEQKHVIYVWFDALINYISALGYPDGDNFKKYWPADVHLIGKEIIRFHCVIWPAMLLAAGLPLPKKVFAHGWWTVEGKKMSKTTGNVVDPLQLVSEFGTDATRYFLLRDVQFGADGDFSRYSFIQRFNSDLANDLGNLLQRSLTMVEKYFEGIVPKTNNKSYVELDTELIELAKTTHAEVEKAMENLQFSEALATIWKLVGKGNLYIEKRAPWTLAKENKTEELGVVLYNLLEIQRIISVLISPFMPKVAENIQSQLGLGKKIDAITKEDLIFGIDWKEQKINKTGPMFPRIDTKKSP